MASEKPCFTDGLVERRGHLIDDGVTRILAAVEQDSVEHICQAVMTAADVEKPDDDVALLIVRRRFDRAATTGRAHPRPGDLLPSRSTH
ncbi:SpoIIE family protein phosphatase [Actinoplanes sp. NPDC023936]|uniref:SpoIIE family protein phosphatase n=1 Tax=Actinoplanes sp. NPDC023936 TaxID=3154910 RepID=UPI0033D4960C